MNENQTTPEQMQPDFCMTVKDNSMKPDGIHKGDKVAFVRCDYVENGQIAAVMVGDQIYLAHVWLDKNGVLQLLPSNVAYSSHFFAGDALNAVQIIGKAVEVRHILNPAGSPESTLPQNDPKVAPV